MMKKLLFFLMMAIAAVFQILITILVFNGVFAFLFVETFSLRNETPPSEFLIQNKDKIHPKLIHHQMLDSVEEIHFCRRDRFKFAPHSPYQFGTIIDKNSPMFSYMRDSKKTFYVKEYSRDVNMNNFFRKLSLSPTSIFSQSTLQTLPWLKNFLASPINNS